MKLLVAIALVSACGSDDGTSLPTCHDCSPGAASAGRFVANELGPQPVVGNRRGQAMRMSKTTLAWLDPTFSTEDTTSFDHYVTNLALDDAGASVVVVGDPNDENHLDNAALLGFGPDHDQTWSVDLGDDVFRTDVAASPSVIVLVTDAHVVGGIDLGYGPSPSVLGIRPSDGSVMWHEPLEVFPFAVAPDGGVLIAGYFVNSLDLGGTSAPMTVDGTAGFVAALDPQTGRGRWAVKLEVPGVDPMRRVAFVDALAAGPAGETAISMGFVDETSSTLPTIASFATIYDADGAVVWTQQTAGALGSIITDGVHIDSTRDGFSQYSATGIDWKQPVAYDQLDYISLLAVAGDHLVAAVHSESTVIRGPEATTRIGDVQWTGNGTALLDLVR